MAKIATPRETAVDLNAILQRVSVSLDGATYHIRDFREFSLLAYRQQLEECARLGALLERTPENAKEVREREQLLDSFCRQVLIAPAAVQDRLVVQQRVEIVRLFLSTVPKELLGTVSTAPATRGSSSRRRLASRKRT